jgi:hypothetical protein
MRPDRKGAGKYRALRLLRCSGPSVATELRELPFPYRRWHELEVPGQSRCGSAHSQPTTAPAQQPESYSPTVATDDGLHLIHTVVSVDVEHQVAHVVWCLVCVGTWNERCTVAPLLPSDFLGAGDCVVD